MKLFRFELAFDGEPQGVGFMQGTYDIGLPKLITSNLYSLFDELPYHELNYEEDTISFWFTEYGLDYFGEAINKVIKDIAEKNWQFVGAIMEDDLSCAIYKDEFQAAFPYGYVWGSHTEYVEVTDVNKFKVLVEQGGQYE